MTPTPTGYVLPLVDHPVVREGAKRLARDAWLSMRDSAADTNAGSALPTLRDLEPWEDVSENVCAWWTDAHARLLCDLSREQSRDWWVRWGKAQANAYHDKRLTRTIAEWWTPETWAALVNRDRARDLQAWESDRDRPETLATAIHAALATLTPATPGRGGGLR